MDFLGDEICDKVTSKALRTVFFWGGEVCFFCKLRVQSDLLADVYWIDLDLLVLVGVIKYPDFPNIERFASLESIL